MPPRSSLNHTEHGLPFHKQQCISQARETNRSHARKQNIPPVPKHPIGGILLCALRLILHSRNRFMMRHFHSHLHPPPVPNRARGVSSINPAISSPLVSRQNPIREVALDIARCPFSSAELRGLALTQFCVPFPREMAPMDSPLTEPFSDLPIKCEQAQQEDHGDSNPNRVVGRSGGLNGGSGFERGSAD